MVYTNLFTSSDQIVLSVFGVVASGPPDPSCPGIDFHAKGRDEQGRLLFNCNCNNAPENSNVLQNCPTANYCFGELDLESVI